MKNKLIKILSSFLICLSLASCEGYRLPSTLSSGSSNSSSSSVSSNSIKDSSSSSSLTTSSVTQNDYVVSYKSSYNTINLNFEVKKDITSFKVEYKLSSNKDYEKLDSSLITLSKAQILGLVKGLYDIKVIPYVNENILSKQVIVLNDVEVKEDYDQSGYAFYKFNTTTKKMETFNQGVGAYNKDGSLKDNAIVIYVNDENKNSLELTVNNKKYVGLADILTNQKDFGVPLVVRIVGSINTNQFKKKEFTPITGLKTNDVDQLSQYDHLFTNELETTYTNLKGLKTNLVTSFKKDADPNSDIYITYSQGKLNQVTATDGSVSYTLGTDTSINMLTLTNLKDVTIEGVFDDAIINQWGITIDDSSSVEVRNLTFKDYPEDACGISGDFNNNALYQNIFVHHNVFKQGKNNWDLTDEQDKHYGDGANDLSGVSNYTSSYNVFEHCKKTGLVGGGNSKKNANITFHHNYYKQNDQRQPLGRQANMHMYNNYYEGIKDTENGYFLDIRANGYAFCENNYFYQAKNPGTLNRLGGTGTIEDPYLTAIKSYNDIFDDCVNKTEGTIVSSREEKVESKCAPLTLMDENDKNLLEDVSFNNYDTNPDLFYYDVTNNKSIVNRMDQTKDIPTIVPLLAGIIK